MELKEYGFTDKEGHSLEMCVDYINLLARAEAAEHRCLELARANQYAIECQSCNCLFVPGGKSVERVCGTCLRERAEAAEKERDANEHIINDVLRALYGDADGDVSDLAHDVAQLRAERDHFAVLGKMVEAQLAAAESRITRMTQYVDDACECARCCECQGWNEECSILAAKKHKGIDIVTGEQLRAAAEGE